MSSTPQLLVVDDEEDVAITLKAVLEREGYAVVAATNEAEARRAVAQGSFGVVLLDLRFGGADGIQLLGDIRAALPFCEGIILTGYASIDSAVAAIRRGAYDYLTKPCSIDELKLTVARAIERGNMARALHTRLAELQAANETIERFAAELGVRVADATAALNMKVQELAAANEALKESQEQRDEFISMVAHELGQPLTAIHACGQLLGRNNIAESEKLEIAPMLLEETRRLTRLVRDLTDTSRVMSKDFQVNPLPCDLLQIIQEQVTVANTSTDRHHVRLELDRITPPLLTECDPDRMAQVMSNLLSNAVKYTKGGEVLVTVAASDQHLIVTVTDEGPGIPRGRLQTIFEPRFRVPVSEGSGSTGMGLGLSITEAIVTAHGGAITARNNDGNGASFVVKLPITLRIGALVD